MVHDGNRFYVRKEDKWSLQNCATTIFKVLAHSFDLPYDVRWNSLASLGVSSPRLLRSQQQDKNGKKSREETEGIRNRNRIRQGVPEKACVPKLERARVASVLCRKTP